MLEEWQRDASETPPLYPGFPSDVAKCIAGDGARRAPDRPSFPQTPVGAEPVLIVELAPRCELLSTCKTSVPRRMYARVPTRGAMLG
jgi:hypothetical protein